MLRVQQIQSASFCTQGIRDLLNLSQQSWGRGKFTTLDKLLVHLRASSREQQFEFVLNSEF